MKKYNVQDIRGGEVLAKPLMTSSYRVIQSENESDDSYHWYYEDYRKTGGTLHNYLQVRIPSEKYESFLSELDGIGKIISKIFIFGFILSKNFSIKKLCERMIDVRYRSLSR